MNPITSAMTFGNIDVSDIEKFVTDDSVAIEQKLDGARCLVTITQDRVEFRQRGGMKMTHSASAQHFPALRASLAPILGSTPGEMVLDGELMHDTGTYYVFDLPYLRIGGVELVRPSDPFSFRRAHLTTQIRNDLSQRGVKNVQIIDSHTDPRMKRWLIEQVTDLGGEGFMVKSLKAAYAPGRRVQHSVKAKFVRTADCVVLSFTRYRENGREYGSASLGVYDSGMLRPVGSCSLIGKPVVEEGSVVEVAFSSFQEAMVQPRLMRVRTDKRAIECTFDQFMPYSKKVLG